MKRKIHISIQVVKRVFVFMIYLFPEYLLRIGLMRNIYYIFASAVSLFFIIWFLFNGARKNSNHIKKMFLLILSFYVVVLISTYGNGGPRNALTAQSLIACGFAGAICYFFDEREYLISLKAIVVWLELCVIINLITVIIFPNGLYSVYGFNMSYANAAYFLGHRNNAVEYLIPLMGCSSYLNLIQGRRNSGNYYFVILLSLFTALLTWSVNEMLCVVAVLGCELLLVNREKLPMININIGYFASAGLTILLVAMDFLSYMSSTIEVVFKKNITVLSRVKIWERAVTAIYQKPWLGYGCEEATTKYMRIGHANSCHNYFLDCFYYGGTILMAIMTLIIFTVSNRVKNINRFVKAKISIFFVSYFVLWIASATHMNQLFIMFGFFMITMSLPWENIKEDDVRSKIRFRKLKA